MTTIVYWCPIDHCNSYYERNYNSYNQILIIGPPTCEIVQ